MARIRTVKPEFWQDEAVGNLSLGARLLFIASWNQADDEGRLRWTPAYMKAAAFMYDDIGAAEVAGFMAELEDAGMVTSYEANRQTFGHVTKFTEHQVISRPSPSRLPAPFTESSVSAHGGLTEDSTQEGKGREQGRERKKSGAIARSKPAWDWLTDPDNPIHLPATNGNTRRIGKFNREISEQLTAEGIPVGDWGMVLSERVRAWPLHFGDATLTPEALVKHLAALGRPPMRGDPKAMRRQALRAAVLAKEVADDG